MNQANDNIALRISLQAVPRALRAVHKALIDVETVYFGAVGGPLEHLQLITNHPHFAWLQPMSILMAALDEALDEPETLNAEAIAGWRGQVEELVGPGTAAASAFRAKYLILLHDSPEVAMAHGPLRKLLGHLPQPSTGTPARLG
ncbi:hypothetical protein [Massilia scottii]|uniref:hypothetical protein n=1 Tax=Massilia scottii TaxID=3057166 RepID=UPI002796A441|nr:hypothetical protein [Massilia sp. CCM 9029]MDQ1829308.1 hypothetical protein [Massilia sp. CCM 9029]